MIGNDTLSILMFPPEPPSLPPVAELFTQLRKIPISLCGSPSCGNDANYIRINHGDGTETLYLHLEHEGVDVEVDDVVCAGDVIGRSGNTGWSTGPHLHFAVVDAYGDTIPFLFEEMITISNGLPIPGYNFLSENTLVESCPTQPFTGCANDLYLHRGILLDSGFPCIVDQAVHIPTLSGTNISQSNQTFVRLTRSDGTNNFESIEFCLDNDVDGRFSVDIDWSEYGTAGDIFYVFVTAAEIEDVAGDMLCTTFYGWERSISVLLK